MSEPVFPRHTTQPRRRQTFLNADKGANQDDARSTDINAIVAQYRRDGTMPSVNQMNPLWGDFTGPNDLHNAIIQIQRAEETFGELPADIRSAAENSPVRFLEMFEDPDQRALLESAGLIIKPTPTPPPPSLENTEPSNPGLTQPVTAPTAPDAPLAVTPTPTPET